MKIASLAFVFLTLASIARAEDAVIYSGEPYGEALFDLMTNISCISIAHPLSQTGPLNRIDAFKLPDGKILILYSTSVKLGEPFTISKISFAKLSDHDLNKLEPLSSFKMPIKKGASN